MKEKEQEQFIVTQSGKKITYEELKSYGCKAGQMITIPADIIPQVNALASEIIEKSSEPSFPILRGGQRIDVTRYFSPNHPDGMLPPDVSLNTVGTRAAQIDRVMFDVLLHLIITEQAIHNDELQKHEEAEQERTKPVLEGEEQVDEGPEEEGGKVIAID